MSGEGRPAPDPGGAWVAWNWEQSYRQGDVKVFLSEVEALRWALNESAGHEITFVPWGSSAYEALDDAKRGEQQ